MDDIEYVERIEQVKQQSAACPRCSRLRAPLLCTTHTQAFTSARRERQSFLLRHPVVTPRTFGSVLTTPF